jgi:hypothetical protein
MLGFAISAYAVTRAISMGTDFYDMVSDASFALNASSQRNQLAGQARFERDMGELPIIGDAAVGLMRATSDVNAQATSDAFNASIGANITNKMGAFGGGALGAQTGVLARYQLATEDQELMENARVQGSTASHVLDVATATAQRETTENQVGANIEHRTLQAQGASSALSMMGMDRYASIASIQADTQNKVEQATAAAAGFPNDPAALQHISDIQNAGNMAIANAAIGGTSAATGSTIRNIQTMGPGSLWRGGLEGQPAALQAAVGNAMSGGTPAASLPQIQPHAAPAAPNTWAGSWQEGGKSGGAQGRFDSSWGSQWLSGMKEIINQVTSHPKVAR